MTSSYTGQRRGVLEALSALLPDHGLVSRLIGGDDPVLWVWHPFSGRQTIVFATPTANGWALLWAPGGRSGAGGLEETANLLRVTLTTAEATAEGG